MTDTQKEIEQRDKIILALQQENDFMSQRLREIHTLSDLRKELLGKVVKPFDSLEFASRESKGKSTRRESYS